MSWSHPGFEAVALLVSRRTGLSFGNRQDSAELGIRRAMGRMRHADLDIYVNRLVADASALDDLISELTVGETYFFREPAHFRFLRERILPEWHERRARGDTLRAWSAGCASGEEAFSLAIMFEQEGLADHVRLVASDISQSALAKARRAEYGPWSLRGEGADAAGPYLTGSGKGFRLDARVRDRVAFSHLNLALDVYPSLASGIWGMDLIFCRNVLIYFDRETIHQVAGRLFQSLAEGGWLVTASSDPPLWEDAPFQVVAREEGLFYQRPGGTAATSRTGLECEASTWRQDEAPAEPESGKDASVLAEVGSAGASPSRVSASLEEARAALARGDYRCVVELTRSLPDDPTAAALLVRALANLDIAAAVHASADCARRLPLAAELHFLHAVLLLDTGRAAEAAPVMRRALYLDRTLAAAHLTLGSILCRLGDSAGARRAYRNARDLCAARPAEEVIPLADGERAGRLAAIAAAELTLLEDC
jgi:chemotaxis protein methyltransferase CheR